MSGIVNALIGIWISKSRIWTPNLGFGCPNPGFGRPNPGFGRPNPGFGRPNPGFGHQILDLIPNPGFGRPIPDLVVRIRDNPTQWDCGRAVVGLCGLTIPPRLEPWSISCAWKKLS